MSITLELKFKLTPEELEGGYIRYTAADMPGFRVLCEPGENPSRLIERAFKAYMLGWLMTALKGNASMKGLRIIPESPQTISRGLPGPIDMEAYIEQQAA